MKKTFVIIFFLVSVSVSAQFVKLPELLPNSEQTFTSTWANIGPQLNVRGHGYIALYIDIDINATKKPRVRIIGNTKIIPNPFANALPVYNRVASTTEGGCCKVEPLFYEFPGIDSKVILDIPIYRCIPFLQIQISAGTTGAPPGKIKSIYYSLGY
jgi:hypothetical protein